jgi:uncharacterized protein YjiS (DUF1127 family)
MASDIAGSTRLLTESSRSIGPPSSIGATAAGLVHIVRQIVAAIKGRRALTRLAELDDRMLADIGLRRSDLDAARSGPLLQNPTSILGEHGRHPR